MRAELQLVAGTSGTPRGSGISRERLKLCGVPLVSATFFGLRLDSVDRRADDD
jgi:hypothetical protein